MSTIAAIIITVLMIGFLIFIHELGHFLAARSVGVKIDKFAIGFGPKLFSKQIAGTEFSLRLIMLGGYVQMFGDQDPSSTTYDPAVAQDPRSYLSKSPLAKLWISSAGVLVNFLFAGIAFAIYLALSTGFVILPQIGDYDFIAADTREEIFVLSDQFGIEESGGIVLDINGEDIDNYGQLRQVLQEIEGEKVSVSIFQPQQNQIIERDLLLNGEGITSNLDTDFLPPAFSASDVSGRLTITNILNASFSEGQIVQSNIESIETNQTVGEQKEGFEDLFLMSVQDKQVYDNDQLISVLKDNLGQSVKVNLLSSEGSRVVVEVQLPDQVTEQGILGVETRLLTPAILGLVMLDYPNFAIGGIAHAINIVGYNAQALIYLIGQAFAGRPELLTENVGSVVAIGGSVNQVINISNEFGASFLLELFNIMGLFSAILAFMNILPIPVLDGGNMLFILIEWIRGKPLPPKLMNVIYMIFVVALIALSIGVVLLDISKLVYN